MDGDFEFVRSVFGFEMPLKTAPREIVEPLRIPERSKRFLTEVGLPFDLEPEAWEFNLMNELPRPRDLFPDWGNQIAFEWDTCRLLSWKDEMGFYLNEADGGTIWHIASGEPGPNFVNSSVELLGWFLAQVYHPLPVAQDASHEQLLTEIDKLEARMRGRDPRAFDDSASWWPLVLEDRRTFG